MKRTAAPPFKPNPNDVQVGWICATSEERVAATASLDINYGIPDSLAENDTSAYTLGRMGDHNVVITALPSGEYGLETAASAASHMLRSFPKIKFGLMVGVGGGAPSARHDIRLGDVVVSEPRDGNGGVFQYDYGRALQNRDFQNTRYLNQPQTSLRNFVTILKETYEADGHQLRENIEAILCKKPRLRKKYGKPDIDTDILYKSDFIHKKQGISCKDACGDNASTIVSRDRRSEEEDDPVIHYGLIATANTLMEDAVLRDDLIKNKDVLCFEMEAGGLMNHFPCIVIRGICDYSDSHRNHYWQGYAAMTAAAYAKDLLGQIPPSNLKNERPLVEMISGIAKQVDEIAHHHRRTEDQIILDWLSLVDYSSQQNDFWHQHTAGTGEWLFKTDQFRKWVDSDGENGGNDPDRTLFCKGIKGAGKTMLTASVVDHLRQKFCKENVCISYVYLNFRRQIDQAARSLLANLVKQLAESYRGARIPEELRKLHEKHARQRTIPSMDELGAVFVSISALYSKHFIVLDALDECEMHDRDKFLSRVVALRSKVGAYLFATSRSIPEVQSHFIDKPSLEIRANEADVYKYVSSRLIELCSCVHGKQALQHDIAACVTKAASDMFLLARIYVELLKDQFTVNDIKATLRGFQKHAKKGNDGQKAALEHAYDAAMQRIYQQQERRKSLAHKVLVWIVRAARPLTGAELQHALALKEREGDGGGGRDVDEDDFIPLRDMISVCAGLVVLDDESQIIRLVHYTTQDYLVGRWAEEVGEQHLEAFKTCARLLSMDGWKGIDSPRENGVGRLLKQYPFFDYVSEYWGFHLDESDDRVEVDTYIEFLQDYSKVETLRTCIGPDVEWGGSFRDHFGPGLYLAIRVGSHKAVRQLLVWDASPNAVEEHHGDTPHSCASCFEDERVAQVLLDHGALVKTTNEYGETPLHFAASRGKEEVVQLLLNHGAVVKATNEAGETPLHHAAGCDNKEVVQLLLDYGAVVKATDGDGETPLHHAAQHGNKDVIQLLLNHGASISAADKIGWLPLHHAAQGGKEEVVQLLLDQGASISAADKIGWLPLHHAAQGGKEEVVQLLLDQGASISVADIHGRTPLHHAMESDKEEVVQLLLDQGASISAADIHGWVPLHYAARYGRKGVVQLLLDQADKDGKTLLTDEEKGKLWRLAKENRRDHSVAQLFMDRFADARI